MGVFVLFSLKTGNLRQCVSLFTYDFKDIKQKISKFCINMVLFFCVFIMHLFLVGISLFYCKSQRTR